RALAGADRAAERIAGDREGDGRVGRVPRFAVEETEQRGRPAQLQLDAAVDVAGDQLVAAPIERRGRAHERLAFDVVAERAVEAERAVAGAPVDQAEQRLRQIAAGGRGGGERRVHLVERARREVVAGDDGVAGRRVLARAAERAEARAGGELNFIAAQQNSTRRQRALPPVRRRRRAPDARQR